MNESAFHPEDKARSLIDRRLVACGWLIQSKADMNLGAGLGVAVREFQTASGPVDYGLFVGRKLCGVIEAKPEGTTLSGFSEQAARYIADVPKHLVREEGQVRPLEVLIFLRDVESELYFEQMKGRGARTIPAEKLREVTPDAEAKTRFVLIDAVGVSESLKTVSQPLERNRAVSFDRLIDDIAAGRRDDDAFATLAARLAALDRRIGEKDRAAIVKASGGVDLSGLASRLLDAIDPDALAMRVPKDAPEPEQKKAREAAKDEAATIFDDPTLRRLLKEVKAAADIRIDTISNEAVVSYGWDEKKATDTVERFKSFLEERRDELAALQILYRLPYAQRRLTYEAVDDLKEALKRPPWLLEPVDIWRAYKRLSSDKVRGNPRRDAG